MGFESANDFVLEESLMGDNISTPMENNNSHEMLHQVNIATFQSLSSEEKDDSYQEDLLLIPEDMNQPIA